MAFSTNNRFGRAIAAWLPILLPLAMIACAGCSSQPAADDLSSVAIQVVDRAGYDAAIAGMRGKVVLVDFWATWCLPCMAQLPHTVELADRFHDRGLTVATVSLDEPENIEQVRAALAAKRAVLLTNFLCRDGGSPQSIADFDIAGGAIPHYKLYDRAGQLRQTFAIDPAASKQFTPADIADAVAKLLAE